MGEGDLEILRLARFSFVPPSSRLKSRGIEKLTYCGFMFDLYTVLQDGNEEAALEDFKAAAGLGSGYAKSMLVEMNPYAAMCNAMLRSGTIKDSE
jgi:hypothetical protein